MIKKICNLVNITIIIIYFTTIILVLVYYVAITRDLLCKLLIFHLIVVLNCISMFILLLCNLHLTIK